MIKAYFEKVIKHHGICNYISVHLYLSEFYRDREQQRNSTLDKTFWELGSTTQPMGQGSDCSILTAPTPKPPPPPIPKPHTIFLSFTPCTLIAHNVLLIA